MATKALDVNAEDEILRAAYERLLERRWVNEAVGRALADLYALVYHD